MGFFSRKKRRANPDDETAQFVFGQNGFGFGPFQVVYDPRGLPTDGGAQSIAYLTELLPVYQRSGPFFENREPPDAVARPNQIGNPVQLLPLAVISDPGITTGQTYADPLTDISSGPGNIPLNAEGNFNIPAA